MLYVFHWLWFHRLLVDITQSSKETNFYCRSTDLNLCWYLKAFSNLKRLANAWHSTHSVLRTNIFSKICILYCALEPSNWLAFIGFYLKMLPLILSVHLSCHAWNVGIPCSVLYSLSCLWLLTISFSCSCSHSSSASFKVVRYGVNVSKLHCIFSSSSLLWSYCPW